ncbi:MAG: carboxypeptidase regulatory-like domain-containing protein, partial [candidate division Zixibacteria bacterium]|nr:carboxypeptidase regulatory-like domain-containing protein [candidate division Zixibacteria bacterium]
IWALDGGEKINTLYELSVEVTALVCTAPTINLTPAADLLEGGHCYTFFQFEADPGMLGQDPATIAGWDVTDGPGSIDGAGLYTVSLPNANTGPVTVEVTNSCGETDDYAFTLNLTTANPVFTNAEDAPDTACAGDVYSYDFDATDSDTCDTVLFASNTGTPVPMNPRSINSASGLFEWEPDPSEIGTTFQFEVWANDEGLAAKSDVMYLLEITVVSCVADDPEITLIHGLLDFEMVVGNPDPAGQELQIANTGTGTLNWELANDSNWLVPTETSGSAPPTSSLMLNINSAGRPVGSYRDTVFVTGNAFNSPQYAIVDLEITEVPVDDEYAVWVGSDSGIPGEDVVIPVTFKNTQELSMIVLPLQFWGLDKITNGITLTSVSYSGSRVDYIASKPVTIDNGTQTVLMGVFVFTEDLIPADSGLMANLHFSIDPTAAPGIVPIDSIFIAPSNSLAFGDDVGDPIYPDFSLGQIEILPPPMPCVELSDSSFTFTGYECGPDPDPQYFDILNCGDIPISWEIIGSGLLPTGSVSFDPSFGNDDHYGVEILVDIDCLPVGTYYDTACVILTDPDKVPPGFQACIEIEVIITEPPEMNIAGEVIDDGTTLPIAGATVELYDFFPSSMLATTTSAGDGTFDFGPYTGSYVVRAYKNGYYQNWVNVTAPDENVQVALTPTDTPPPTPEWVNLYCDWATFEDYPILAGDVVEAYDPTGVLCGQFFVTTEGAYGFLAVYRDDGETTPAVDEGCDPGDAITVKLNGFDMTPFLDSPVSWTTNGDNLEACFDGYIEKEICLHLDSAWNLISWNVDTEDDAIDVVLADIMHLVEVVLGFEQGAMTFDPDLLDFSTLDFTDHFHGYWVKVSDSVTFCLTGLPVDPATPIHLEDGWNLASY